MTALAPATFTQCGLAFSVGNGAIGSSGQSGLFWIGDQDPDSLNLITVTITNPSGAQVTLYADTPPDDAPTNGWWLPPASGSNQSWWSLALPQSWFTATALEQFTLSVAGGMVSAADFTLAQANDANGAFIVILLKQNIVIDEDDEIVLTLQNVVPDGTAPRATLLDIGAFFWNLVGDGVCESAIQPVTWSLTAAVADAAILPVTLQATTAAFGTFTSDDVGRAPNVAYLMPPAGANAPTIENILAIDIDFALENDSLAASGESYFLLSAVVDCAAMPWIPSGTGILAALGDATNASLAQLAPASPQWEMLPGRSDESGTFVEFEIDFGDYIAQGADVFTLQLEQLVANVPAGITSVSLSWYAVPGYVDGSIALPIGVVAPVPALVSASSAPPAPLSVLTPVTLQWVAYAAGAVQIHCTGASGVSYLQATTTDLAGTWSTGTYANPLTDPVDQNSSQIAFQMVAYDFSGAPAGSPITLEVPLIAPDYSAIAFTGAVTFDSTGNPTTTFTFPAFDASIAYTLTAMPSGTTVTGTNGPDPISLAVPAVGGSVTVSVTGPGGGTFAAQEARSWTGTAPPCAQSVVVFVWDDQIYTWAPGAPAAENQTSLFPTAYNWEFNNLVYPALVVWPGESTVFVPTSRSSTIGVTSLSALQVAWNVGAPQYSVSQATMADALASPSAGYEGYGYVGPFLLGGPALTTLPAGYPQINSIGGTPSPRYALCFFSQTLRVGGRSTILSIDGITSPSLSAALNLPTNGYPAMWNSGIALQWPMMMESAQPNFALIIAGSTDASGNVNTLAVLNQSACVVSPNLPGTRFSIDFDPVNMRLALAMTGSNADQSWMSLYAAAIAPMPDSGTLEMSFDLVCEVPNRSGTIMPVVAVGPRTGALYTVGTDPTGSTAMIVMVTGNGTIMPLCVLPTGGKYDGVVSLAAIEPAYAQPQPTARKASEHAR